MTKQKTAIIFSDFDGTITEHDVIVMIMEKFAPPEWVQVKDDILYRRTITLKDGVEKLFSFIPASKKNEIITFVRNNVKIRNGFEQFLIFCKNNNIEFNVLSGGLDFFIEEVLSKWKSQINIFCNEADFTSEKIKIRYKYLPEDCNVCGECGCCKIEIIEKSSKDKYLRVLIGDSLTDLAPSKVVDIVFARSDLIKYLEQENIKYIPFNDFYEVVEKLKQIQLQIV